MKKTLLLFTLVSFASLSACADESPTNSGKDTAISVDAVVEAIGETPSSGVYAILRNKPPVLLVRDEAEWRQSVTVSPDSIPSDSGFAPNPETGLVSGNCFDVQKDVVVDLKRSDLLAIAVVGLDLGVAPAVSDPSEQPRNGVFCRASRNSWQAQYRQVQGDITVLNHRLLIGEPLYLMVHERRARADRPVGTWVLSLE